MSEIERAKKWLEHKSPMKERVQRHENLVAFSLSEVVYLLASYAASDWVDVPKFEAGQRVRVDHPRFHGEGIVEYDTGIHRRMVGVKLENGNVWEYEFETVEALPQAPTEEAERG